MTTIQGIIQKGIVNAQVQFDKMGYVSTNVSNYNTTGYKGVRFEQMLSENGYLTGVERTNYSPAAIQRTSRDFDIAIKGVGFIPVTSPTGEVTYTREGSLKLDKDGYLITNDGYLVGDGIQFPVNYENFVVKPNGDIELYSNDGTQQAEVIGNIPLVNFMNPEGLRKSDNNKYYLTAESGEPVLVKDHTRFVHGSLEASNINMFDEINEIMRMNASLLASFKVMQTVNDMYSKALQLNQ